MEWIDASVAGLPRDGNGDGEVQLFAWIYDKRGNPVPTHIVVMVDPKYGDYGTFYIANSSSGYRTFEDVICYSAITLPEQLQS